MFRGATGRSASHPRGRAPADTIAAHAGWIDDSEGAVGAVAALCARGMADTLGSFDIGPETQCDWLRVVVPWYLENDYGLGDDLGRAIARVR